MSRSRFVRTGFLAVALALATAAVASEPTSTSKKGKDPNEKICENQGVLGSRLAKRRVCATRAEWEERKQRERDMVDRTQMQQCVAVEGVCSRGN